MDYETKLILERLIDAINNNSIDSEQLIEAISKPDSPDWWMIVLTIINIVAFVFVAYTQIKQQKQQTKLQELQVNQQDYDFNKSLFTLIKEIDNQIINFMFNLFISTDSKLFGINKLSELKYQLNKLHEQLLQSAIDFELRFPNEKMIKSDYRDITIYMWRLYNRFIDYIKDGSINTNIELDIDTEVDIRMAHTDEMFKNGIMSRIENKIVYSKVSDALDKFIFKKSSILNKGYADKIATLCKRD